MPLHWVKNHGYHTQIEVYSPCDENGSLIPEMVLYESNEQREGQHADGGAHGHEGVGNVPAT